jgi:hypothetical protein
MVGYGDDGIERGVVKLIQPTGCAWAVRSANCGCALLVYLNSLRGSGNERQYKDDEHQGLLHFVLLSN